MFRKRSGYQRRFHVRILQAKQLHELPSDSQVFLTWRRGRQGDTVFIGSTTDEKVIKCVDITELSFFGTVFPRKKDKDNEEFDRKVLALRVDLRISGELKLKKIGDATVDLGCFVSSMKPVTKEAVVSCGGILFECIISSDEGKEYDNRDRTSSFYSEESFSQAPIGDDDVTVRVMSEYNEMITDEDKREKVDEISDLYVLRSKLKRNAEENSELQKRVVVLQEEVRTKGNELESFRSSDLKKTLHLNAIYNVLQNWSEWKDNLTQLIQKAVDQRYSITKASSNEKRNADELHLAVSVVLEKLRRIDTTEAPEMTNTVNEINESVEELKKCNLSLSGNIDSYLDSLELLWNLLVKCNNLVNDWPHSPSEVIGRMDHPRTEESIEDGEPTISVNPELYQTDHSSQLESQDVGNVDTPHNSTAISEGQLTVELAAPPARFGQRKLHHVTSFAQSRTPKRSRTPKSPDVSEGVIRVKGSTDKLNLSRKVLKQVSASSMDIPDDISTSDVRTLDISRNSLRSMIGIPKVFSVLKHLDVSHNRISTLRGAPLALSTLIISQNHIFSLNGIERLTCLRVLDISGNNITTLDPLSRCEGLVVVTARRNAITDIQGIVGLTNLQTLEIEHNEVQSLDDIRTLIHFPTLTRLALMGNKVSLLQAYRALIRTALPNLLFLDGRELAKMKRKSGKFFQI